MKFLVVSLHVYSRYTLDFGNSQPTNRFNYTEIENLKSLSFVTFMLDILIGILVVVVDPDLNTTLAIDFFLIEFTFKQIF